MISSYNSSKLYSINDLLLLYKNDLLTPSSYFQDVIHKTNQFDTTLHAYISFGIKGDQNQNFQITKTTSNKKLENIPFNIKDCFLTKDFVTTNGVKGELVHSAEDSLIIKLFKKEGAVLVGKTSLPAYAYDVQTFNDILGITPNPWDSEHSSGGSTGGGAVSVATGLIPLAIGSDFAGSIRIPAHFCGVKGFIPTIARKYLAGHYPDTLKEEKFQFAVGQVGFLSNFLSDFEIIDALISTEQNKADSFKIHDFRCTISLRDQYMPVDSEISQSLRVLANVMQSDGIEVAIDFPEYFNFKDLGKIHAELMNKTFTQSGEKPQEVSQRSSMQKKLFIEDLDDYLINRFWILPVSATCAIKHNLDHNPIEINSRNVPYWRAMIHYVRPFNLTDNPIITLPIGKNSKGLPIGVQIISSKGTDYQLIKFAQYLEEKIGKIGHPLGYGLSTS